MKNLEIRYMRVRYTSELLKRPQKNYNNNKSEIYLI